MRFLPLIQDRGKSPLAWIQVEGRGGEMQEMAAVVVAVGNSGCSPNPGLSSKLDPQLLSSLPCHLLPIISAFLSQPAHLFSHPPLLLILSCSSGSGPALARDTGQVTALAPTQPGSRIYSNGITCFCSSFSSNPGVGRATAMTEGMWQRGEAKWKK